MILAREALGGEVAEGAAGGAMRLARCWGAGLGNRVDGAILAGGRAGRKGGGERADATVRSRARA